MSGDMAKTESFTRLDVDLERLATRIQTYLQENDFEIAFSKDPTGSASWFFIQARKAGALRTVAGARRSMPRSGDRPRASWHTQGLQG